MKSSTVQHGIYTLEIVLCVKLISKLRLAFTAFVVANWKQAFAYTDNYLKLGFSSEVNGSIRSQGGYV